MFTTAVRLYGKKDEKEGTGVNIVFKNSFFYDKPVFHHVHFL